MSMRKIKHFLLKWFDEDFWSAVVSLLIVSVVAFGIPSLLIWADSLPFLSEFYIGNLSWGMVANTIVFLAVVIFAVWTNIGPDTFIYRGTMGKGRICLLLSALAVFAVYISVVWVYLWWVVFLSIVVFLICGYALGKLKADDRRINLACGIELIYCIGTYCALQINGLEPAISLLSLLAVLLVSLVMFFKPAFE